MLAEEIHREDELLSEVDDAENGSETMEVELKEPVSGEGNGKEKLGADNKERSTEFKVGLDVDFWVHEAGYICWYFVYLI